VPHELFLAAVGLKSGDRALAAQVLVLTLGG